MVGATEPRAAIDGMLCDSPLRCDRCGLWDSTISRQRKRIGKRPTRKRDTGNGRRKRTTGGGEKERVDREKEKEGERRRRRKRGKMSCAFRMKVYE